MSRNPTTKSKGLAFRQARMEGKPEPGSRGTDQPSMKSFRTAGPVGGPAGKGTSGPSAKMTNVKAGQAKGMSYCSTKTRAVVGPKAGPGPSGIGQSGRGAPIT